MGFWGWLAWLLPRKLVYWAAIRLMTYSRGTEPLSELFWLVQAQAQYKRTCIDALRAW